MYIFYETSIQKAPEVCLPLDPFLDGRRSFRQRGIAASKPGKNLIAIHCHQTNGGRYVDLGFVRVQNN
jgi:hypothetical protein